VEQLELEKLKTELHRTLISKLDLEKLSRVNSAQAREAVSNMIHEMIVGQRVPLSFEQQARVQDDLLDEVFGLGPLEPLLKDQSISDILVNDKDHVFVERRGILKRVNVSFRDDRHLLADGLDREVDPRHQDQGLQPGQGVARAVGVDGGHGPVVACVHGLQHVQGFFSTNLANDDAVRTHTQTVYDQLTLSHLPFTFDVWWARLQTDNMFLVELQFRCIFDSDDSLFIGNM